MKGSEAIDLRNISPSSDNLVISGSNTTNNIEKRRFP